MSDGGVCRTAPATHCTQGLLKIQGCPTQHPKKMQQFSSGSGFRFRDKCAYNNPLLKTNNEHNQNRESGYFGEEDGSMDQKG